MTILGDLRKAGLAISFAMVLTLLSQPALCGDRYTVIELTGANTGFSFADDAAWGWWNPSKYDVWEAAEDEKFGFAEARLEVTGKTYTFVLGIELYPTLEALGTLVDPESGDPTSTRISTDIEVFDLGYGQRFQTSRKFNLFPWLGLTHIRINESRPIVDDPENSESDSAKSRLWGIAAGAEGGLSVSQRWTITGRVVIRWARGDRDSVIHTSDPDDGPQMEDVELSDKVSRTMWGVEIGARWIASKAFQLEGGWRYRDWSLNDGPGSFSGPYLLLAIGF